MNTKEIVSQLYRALSSGDADLAKRIIAPDWNNRMKVDEPPAQCQSWARWFSRNFRVASACLRQS
jgi:hypothetical protein